MEAYRAVISLHNLGYKLMALEGNQVAICPAVSTEHGELIRAIQHEPKEACKAIQCLPHLCMVIMPAVDALRQYATDLFRNLQDQEYIRIVKIRISRQTGETAWIYVPAHKLGYEGMLDIVENRWGEYYECKEEGQCWGA